jgi:glycerol-3-phosphate acyltransferase PlsY
LDIIFAVLAIVAAYIIGSFPSAYVIARLRKNIDIRQVGSHNMGAMNVFYKVGFFEGVLVLVFDIGKGAAAVALARFIGVAEVIQLAAGFAALLGHNFPVFLKFRGGRGGATAIGIFAYLLPWGIPFYLALFGLILLVTRFATLSYSLAFLCFPVVGWLIYHDMSLVIYTLVILVLLLLGYVSRLKEMRTKGGSWRHVFYRKNMRDRL